MVESIRYINIAAAVHRHTRGVIELTIATTLTAPFDYKDTVAIKLLDAMVAIIRYVDIVAAVYDYTRGALKLSVAAAPDAPLG